MPSQSIATNVELTEVYTLIAEFGREKLRQRSQPSANIASPDLIHSDAEANACRVDKCPNDNKEAIATIGLTLLVDETISS